MSKQLVSVQLPGGPGASLHACFVPLDAPISSLVAQFLVEDGPQIRRAVVGLDDQQDDSTDWRIQRVLQTPDGAERTEEELAQLDEGLLPDDLTVEQALATAGPEPPPSSSSAPTTAFSAFALTSHLHAPSLRLVYLPQAATVTFEHVPGFPEGWTWTVFLAAGQTAGEVVECIVDELGVKKVLAQGHKTARVEYVVQVRDSKGIPQVLSSSTKVLSHIRKVDPGATSPFSLTFTISPSWLKKAGTVALALPSASADASSKPRVASRDGGGWRSSLFGGMWGQDTVKEVTGEALPAGEYLGPEESNEEEEEEEEEDGDTLKGEKATASASTATPSSAAASGGRARLSTLFTDWIAPEANASTSTPATPPAPSSPPPPPRPHARVVGEPMAMSRDLSRRFSSFTPGDRLSVIHSQGSFVDEDEVDEAEEEDLDAALEQLMDELGMKDAQRPGMRLLPDDRKRFLVMQHRDSQARTAPEPLRPHKTGPVTEATSGSVFNNVKRFSLASVGWSAVSPPLESSSPQSPARPSSIYGGAPPGSPSVASPSPTRPTSPHLQTQPTGSSSTWTSWWSAASNLTGAGQGGTEQAKDSPQFYVDQLRSTKISQRSLAKHLIALRVRLSTAKLSWTQDFLGSADGLGALEALLGRIVQKASEKGAAASEEDKTVQAECVKCLRALMNTDLGFQQVLIHPNLVSLVTHSLYTPSNKLRALVADVLAALCVLSAEEGHRLVLSAFSDARIAHDEQHRFENLLDSIKLPEHDDTASSIGGEEPDQPEEDEAGLWEWRTAAMALINALTNTPNDLEERIMLRDEFTRRGLNEIMTGLRYVGPPDHFLTQLNVYVEEQQADQEELHEQTLGLAHGDASSAQLPELIRLAQEHADLYPRLVETLKKTVSLFDRKDLDDALRDGLVTVLDSFVEHAAHLEDFDQSWRSFMRSYLSSLQPLVGPQSIIHSSRVADTATVPTSFLEELEGLRLKVDELSEERTALRKELNEQIAETNTLSYFSSSSAASAEGGDRSPRTASLKKGDKENFAGVIQRLVQKEKEVIELQAKLAGVQRNGPDEEDARKERSSQNKRWEALLGEIGQNKIKIANLENDSQHKEKEILFLKRTLESVYSRFQSTVETAVSGPGQPVRTPPATEPSLDPELMANKTLEALAQREGEVESLKKELEVVKSELAKAQRGLGNTPFTDQNAYFHHTVSYRDRISPTASASAASTAFYSFVRSSAKCKASYRSTCSSSTSPSSRSSRATRASRATRPSRSFGAFCTATTSSTSRSAASLTPGGPPPPPPPMLRSAVPLKPKAPQKKMKPFFWTKLPSERVGESVWQDGGASPVELIDLDKEFAVGPPLIREAQTETKLKKKREVTTMLGHSRAQNVAIVLARLKLPASIIRDAVLRIDDSKLSVDSLKAIKHHAPTDDEIELIRSYTGELALLAPADQYFLEMAQVPRLSERLAAMVYRRKLDMDMEELKPDLSILRKAAEELKASTKFRKLLQTVLAIGNALNASTFRGGAAGFSLESLLKLKDVRPSNPSKATPTLLHYLVRVVQPSDPALLTFLEDAPHVEAASRISTATVMQTVRTLVEGVKQAQSEIEVIKQLRDKPANDQFVPVMEQFVRHASPAMDALSRHGDKLSDELKALLVYFGEDPAQSKPEELFDLVAQFSSVLLRAEGEVKLADAAAEAEAKKKGAAADKENKLAPPPPPDSPIDSRKSRYGTLTPSASPSTGTFDGSLGRRGQFDSAIRDLRNGVLTRRQRSTAAERDRPLSRIFLSS
ncbi:hypothetical protein JCM8097_005193 [Rhodosporidiobolus ruineniae]